jgi:transposase, IS30 family
MDCQDYIILTPERKKWEHLGLEERGAIKALRKQGLGIRAIARKVGCAPSTVTNELKRGTPPRKSNRGKAPDYSPKRGEAVYKANREVCRKPLKARRCKAFTDWVVKQVREHKWSLDACCGYAKLHQLFQADETVCTRTLYNMVWAGVLSITPTELPEALKRKIKEHMSRENKKRYGESISNRPEIAALRKEEGHWEGDTVVGKRAGKEAVVFSLLEKKTETYLAFRIADKTSDAVMDAMRALHCEYADRFADVFKTITVDNGSEFADFAQVADWGAKVYFAHPYSSWERPQNERHNGLFRTFVPKGMSIEQYTDEDILTAADELNGRPRRKLGYRTPEELFDAFLDAIYAA